MQNYLRTLRSKLIFWILEKYTYPEVIPLTVYGAQLIREGDIAVVNRPEGIDLGEVITYHPPTVYIRLFRRPI